jgi:hypothetical protein
MGGVCEDLSNPQGRKQCLFAQMQEDTRNEVARAFKVLQAR